ncbi:hypothetical protein [Cribrihabitans marinus]|uniref:hypothetical protein n=1 Tax=Cribrihabitans marinus TaxID=1227549 RepID=UPI001160054A|nr:hypothetical protein [Cribrihabitans marinus]GGH24350.1 hypothetical protein GCM10010973_10820 [Cribrihabitans marinus]
MRAFTLFLALLLASCGSITGTAVKTVAGAALGVDGGPSLSANVQAGKNNARSTVGNSRNTDIKVAPVLRENAIESLNQDNRTSADERTVTADRVETVFVTQNQVPAWLLAVMGGLVILFGAVGWLSPQPAWLRRRLDYTEP